MNFMNDVAPVMLYELPRAERADLALENIKEIDNFLDFEQCLIKEEAYAACGPFWEELPVILEEAQGATVLLAVVTTRKNELSLTWRWVDTGGRKKRTHPVRVASRRCNHWFFNIRTLTFHCWRSHFENRLLTLKLCLRFCESGIMS